MYTHIHIYNVQFIHMHLYNIFKAMYMYISLPAVFHLLGLAWPAQRE